MRCAVVGAGVWGAALADLLARNGHEASLWAYESDVVESINAKHENVRFLRGYALSPDVPAQKPHVLVLGVDRFHDVGFVRPKRSLVSVPREKISQRRTPHPRPH